MKSDISKSTKDAKDSRVNTPAYNDNLNSITLSNLTTINQNRKAIFRLPNNKNKKEKEHTCINTAAKGNDYIKKLKRVNKC